MCESLSIAPRLGLGHRDAITWYVVQPIMCLYTMIMEMFVTLLQCYTDIYIVLNAIDTVTDRFT